MEGVLSPADVAVLSGNNNGKGMFGDGWAWIIVLILIFGWGRNGYGYGNGGGSGAFDNYVLSSDFSMLSRQLSDGFNSQERKLDIISNGICSLGYDQLAQMNGVNTNILTTGNAIQGQIADCCCKTQRAIDSVNFNNAQNTCAITNAINLSTRDIVDNQNCNYQKLHEEIINNRIEDLKEANRLLTAKNTSLELAASQYAQNNYIVNTLTDRINPKAVPAYVVPNPNCCYNYNCCGCNNF